MRVVIDTNILISAMLKDRLPEAAILCVVLRPDLEWVVCPEILEEYLEVIARPKFGFPEDLANRWRGILHESTVLMDAPQIAIDFPRDRKDARFLACAVTAGAGVLISGDGDMEDARELIDTTIVSPVQFVRLLDCEEGRSQPAVDAVSDKAGNALDEVAEGSPKPGKRERHHEPGAGVDG